MAEEITGDVGEKATIPAHTPVATTGTPDFASMVPEAFKDKPWMNEIDSMDKLFNQLDSAQNMIGKKSSGIPQANASQEDWDKFFSEAGRPQAADLYEFDKMEGLEVDNELEKSVKELMFKAGLSADQGKKLQSGYLSLMVGLMNKNKESEGDKDKRLNEEFETLTKKHFGDRQEEALATSKKLLAKLAPSEFHEHITNLDNKSLVALAVVLDAVNKKYVNEDSIDATGDSPLGMTGGDLRNKARQMITHPAYKDPFHPQHEAHKQEVNDIYKKIAAQEIKR